MHMISVIAVKESRDPSTNVVLLEDSAAVLGLGIAGAAISLSHYTGEWIYEPLTSKGHGFCQSMVLQEIKTAG